jgi:NAD(P)-dependent dehydrogenase (short-subunit alcohol dehydrogenase family)
MSELSELRFDGRVAVITGAGGGLGRCHAIELASRGAAVVVNDLGGTLDGQGRSASAQRVVDEIVASGGKATASHSSVATPDGATEIVQTALDTFGRIDILVNNAGILRDKAFHNMDAQMIESVLDVHLKGALFVSQLAFTHMRRQGYGRIINTSSASGLFGNFGQANYGAAKAGLAGLVRVLALEGEAYGIKVNAIAPLAATRMTGSLLGDLAEKATPESISPVVAYLAHESCSVSGNIYSVSGGRVALIFFAETQGAVLPELTAESVRDSLPLIHEPADYLVPTSLDDEIKNIAKALA